ncbi:methyltransferase [Flavisolibacter sp. BT320]|nr:methyltransferase [Flavisolibacter longurius]
MKKKLQFVKRFLSKPEGLTLKDVGPVSRSFGFERGTPVDRYYIHQFLATNQEFIKGRILEIAESKLSRQYAAEGSHFEVLHVTSENVNATIIGDLTKKESLPSNAIDCFICTQTYNFIYQVEEAIRGTYHLLNQGGCVLATVAGISQISQYDASRWGDYWRFTPMSIKRLFEDVFGAGNVEVTSYGNCLTAVSLLRGIAVEELNRNDLDVFDPDYPVIISIKAIKAI